MERLNDTGIRGRPAALLATGFLLLITAPSGVRADDDGTPAPIHRLSPEQQADLKAFMEGERSVLAFSPDLGWTVRPKVSIEANQTNSAGLRARREYAPRPPKGVVRIAAFGDSFVYGSEVANPVAWAAVVERLNPRVEVLNFGVPGYGLDQALLRYRLDGRRFKSEIVLIGVMDDDPRRARLNVRLFNNLREAARAYRPTTIVPMPKPRFRLEDTAFIYEPNPLRSPEDLPNVQLSSDNPDDLSEMDPSPLRLGRALSHLRGMLTDANPTLSDFTPGNDTFELNARILEELAMDVKSDGAVPVVVFFPYRGDIREGRAGRPAPYAPLVDRLRSEDILVADLLPEFSNGDETPIRDLFLKLHYSPMGNARVARALLDFLEENGLVPARPTMAHAQK